VVAEINTWVTKGVVRARYDAGDLSCGQLAADSEGSPLKLFRVDTGSALLCVWSLNGIVIIQFHAETPDFLLPGTTYFINKKQVT
jgi:hypothetical protein